MVTLLDGFFVARGTHIAPWDCGVELPRRRFYEAAAILAQYLELAILQRTCPLMSGST